MRTLLTFLCVSFGELIFRANGISAAFSMIGSIFRGWQTPFLLTELGLDVPDLVVAAIGLAILFAFEFMQERGKLENMSDKIAHFPLLARWSLLLGGIAFIAVFGVYGAGYDPAPFIYFQF